MPGDEIILHYYYDSPYARKIVWALELKKIPYRVVLVSNVLPRPTTSAISGGYRRIPILQIGADVYCDTALILDELERRFPEPSLVPKVGGGAFLSQAMAVWCGKFMFTPATSLLPFEFLGKEFLEDRSKMQGNPIPVEVLKGLRPFLREQVRAGLTSLEQALAESKTGWLADQPHPTHLDIHAAMVPWFLYKIVITEQRAWITPAAYPKTIAWIERLAEVTGGRKGSALATPMTEPEALAVARAAKGASVVDAAPAVPAMTAKKGTFLEFAIGDAVTVAPDDYGKDPVRGTLAGRVPGKSVAVRVEGPDGLVTVVHFPVAGYVVKPAKKAKL
ncbi:hypothetical protein HDU96_004861 [Phlyctochytrium bullatum]|nr:hypothetical protein HDU96_004861 [Phlyctochytrium bullatum]